MDPCPFVRILNGDLALKFTTSSKSSPPIAAMDTCPFVRILIGDLVLKFTTSSESTPLIDGSGVGVLSSSSPCFYKIKLANFPSQSATIFDATFTDSPVSPSLAATFSLNSSQLAALKKPVLKISIFAGHGRTMCTGNCGAKLLGKLMFLLDLVAAEIEPCVFQNGWVKLGKQHKKGLCVHLCVRAEPDPRFMFRFEGEPACNPRVFHVRKHVKEPVFICKLVYTSNGDFKNSRSIMIQDLSGSPVAMASMVTPFVASPGLDRVSRSNPGAWLLLRPGDSTWKPWGRLEAWHERSGSDAVGYKFDLLTVSPSPATATTVARGVISTASGGKFAIDMSSNIVSLMTSRQSYLSFVMSSTIEGSEKRSKAEVEVGMHHVKCSEDAARFLALAAATNLSMDACRLFSQKLPKELRHLLFRG